MNNFIITFIVDFVKRFISKTPWFFKVLQGISAVAYLITGLPGHIQYLCNAQIVCITLPDAWIALYNQAASVASVVIIFVAQLAVTTPVLQSKNIKE